MRPLDTEPKAPPGRDVRPHHDRDGVPSVDGVGIRN